jgi:hypothetical protein
VPGEGDEVIGLHCVCVHSYDEHAIHFANSWGVDWGNDGYGKLSSAFFDACLIEAYAHQPMSRC